MGEKTIPTWGWQESGVSYPQASGLFVQRSAVWGKYRRLVILGPDPVIVRPVPMPRPASLPAQTETYARTTPAVGRRWASLWPWAAVIGLILPALWPLAAAGFFVSDDGRFHVYRLAALAAAWRQGVLWPRLFPDFGFGYGQAVLHFYSPAGYGPGALLAVLGVAPSTAAEVTIALGFVLAALAVFAWVRRLWGVTAGLVAAALYTYFPYHLADAYVRGAIPEHLAFIFPPLVLGAYTAAFGLGRRADAEALSPTVAPLLWAGLAWAGLALTHHLSALMLAPAAVAYALLPAGMTPRRRRVAGLTASLVLGLGLSAAYWLPAFLDRGNVGLGFGVSRGYANHMLDGQTLIQPTLLYRYPASVGYIRYPLSWLTAALFVATTALLLARRQRLSAAGVLGFHLGLVAITVFLTTAASLPLWYPLTPILGQLQYPWRLFVLTALGVAVSGAGLVALAPRSVARGLAAVLVVLAAVVGMGRLVVQPLALPAAEVWSPQRMWDEDAVMGQVGATWTGEFVPVTVREQRWALGRAREDAADGPPLPEPLSVRLVALAYDAWTVAIETPAPLALRLHQFHLPGWQARLDGRPTPTYASGELGLVTVDVPAGRHEVVIAFTGGVSRWAGAGVALAAALAWAAWAWRAGRQGHGLRPVAAVVLALVLLLLGNGLGLGRQTRIPAAVTARWGDVARLIAWEARPAPAADALDVTLYWLALRETTVNYKAFVHLLDGAGQVIAQHDGDPVGGYTPTTRWRPGKIIADTHRIPLPPGLTPGAYGLKAGLYDLTPTGPVNLPLDPPTSDGRAELGVFRVDDR